MSELDSIRADKIKKHLKHKDIKIFAYDSIDSTNLRAREYVSVADERSPALFISREQTCGRGRLGRSFLSRKDQGIYMSLTYFTRDDLSDAVSITTAAAVFVARAVEKATGIECRIKWVNDIYTSDGKISGILTETVKVADITAVIVGIGINLGKNDFPEELCGIAASAGEIEEADELSLVAEITDSLLFQARCPKDRAYMTEYRNRFMLTGLCVDIIRAGETVSRGQVLGVSDDGGLIFMPDGEARSIEIHTGEVSVRKSNKGLC